MAVKFQRRSAALNRPADRLSSAPRPPAARQTPAELELLDHLGRRAARLLVRHEQLEEFKLAGALTEDQEVEDKYALREMHAISDLLAEMTATGPAGAVHQLVAVLGLTCEMQGHELDANEQAARIEAMRRLLVSALRVLLPLAGLTPSDTLAEYHLMEDEVAFLKGCAGAA